ncbi:nucleoid-associated protein [Desulfotomaculum defluvii]
MNIRDCDNITIKKVIVHVIDRQNSVAAEKSQSDIDVASLEAKVRDFIENHIRTSITNNESKMACFEQRNTNVQVLVNEMIQDPDRNFVSNSQRIADILFSVTPTTASIGCIVVVLYNNNTEDLLAIIKLDKNDSITYERNDVGTFVFILKGTALPVPSKKSKLHKFAVIRNTDAITDDEWKTKPGLIVLDKQVTDFSLFFYRDFLLAQFLLTDEHKSEKLMEGVKQYLRVVPELQLKDKHTIIQSFGTKLENGEEFTVDEAARQILSPYYQEPESLENAVEGLERTVLERGIGDISLRGVITPKIEKGFKIVKINTLENIYINIPQEHFETRVEVRDSEFGPGKDIVIKNVNIKC